MRQQARRFHGRNHVQVLQNLRGGLVIKARRRLYHSTLGSRVVKKTGERICAHNLKDYEKECVTAQARI